MRRSMLLIRPTDQIERDQSIKNIFQQIRISQSLPSVRQRAAQARQARHYDYIGPSLFRQANFFKSDQSNRTVHQAKGANRYKSHNRNENKNKSESYHSSPSTDFKAKAFKALKDKATTNNQSFMQTEKGASFQNTANTTFLNQDLSKPNFSKSQRKQTTKDKRNIDNYRLYQEYWGSQASRMKRILRKQRPSILEMSQNIIVQENPQKQSIINDNIVNYWEMSLRNNNPILQRHIKGHKFNRNQLEQKLQRISGTKQVENSVPKLPVQSLKRFKEKRSFSLSGRSKGMESSKSRSVNSTYFDLQMEGQNSGKKNPFVKETNQEIYKVDNIKRMSSRVFE